MENFQVYRDIQARTGGDIYIGVVGPVRTGKSTFIRRFMELVALPDMEPAKQAEVRDQLPLSGSGKLITTVEPKFIPKEAVNVNLGDDQKVRIRLIDCVGFLVKDASGHIEDGRERMVKTPWFEKAIPFGLQHVLAMFVANIAPILIVAGAVKLSTEETGALVQAAMIIAGIGSLFQLYPLGPLGSGLPIIMGISFTFVSTFCVIGAKYGYGAVLGAALVGGVLEGLIGMGAKYWRRFIPPIVSASVVTAIGFSLLGIGANSFGGGFGNGRPQRHPDRSRLPRQWRKNILEGSRV